MRLGDLEADLTRIDDGAAPVVLLHGLTFDRSTWRPPVSALAGRRAIALEPPEHGGSPRRRSYDLREVADVLHAAITAAGARAPVLVGHSIGGVLATVYASRHPTPAVLNIDQPLLAGAAVLVVLRPARWPVLCSRTAAQATAVTSAATAGSRPGREPLRRCIRGRSPVAGAAVQGGPPASGLARERGAERRKGVGLRRDPTTVGGCALPRC